MVTPDGTGPMLLDAKVSLKANTKEFIEYMYNPGNGHQYASSRVPNSDEKRLLYLLSDEMVGFNAPVTCENDVAIAGKLTSFGETNIYAQSNFHDITRFYGDVIFNSSMTKIVYDSSAIGHLEILSNQDSTNTSILVQNDSLNNHMPSMLVYNTENPINDISVTENLIFSISGENVSIGEIYGQNTFDVKGDSSFLGKVGIGKPNPESTLDVEGQITSSGKISGNGGIHSGSAKTSGFFVNSNDTNQLSYNDIKDARGYIGTNYSGNNLNELDFHSINTNNNTDPPGGFRFYGHTHDSLKGDLYCNINSTGMHLDGKFTVTGEMEISDNVRLDKSLDVHGVTTFQAITYGATPEDDASGQEFPTCQWINDNYSAAGGWKKEESNNGIYNSNIERDNGYVGIGTKTPEYMLDVNGDIHVISGDLILEEGDISMNGSIVADGSIAADGSITTRSDITVDGSANIGIDMTIGGKVRIGLGTEPIDTNFVLDISGDMYSNGNILTRGNVGIGERGTKQVGTNEPEFTLDVGGTMRVSDTVTFEGPVYGPAPSLSNTDGGGLQLVTMKWVLDKVGNDGGWITTDKNSMYNGNLDNDGENDFVGIGTKTPKYTLDVSGNLNINGKMTCEGGMDVSGGLIVTSAPGERAIVVTDGGLILENGGLDVSGTTTFSNNISIQSSKTNCGIAIGAGAGANVNAVQLANSIAIGNGVIPTEEYQIKIGGNYNKVTIPGMLTVTGNLIVNGTTTSLNTENIDVSTNLISLNNGLTGPSINDAGILIYRGDASNVFMGWSEEHDKFLFGTTNATVNDVGYLIIDPVDITVRNMSAEGNLTLIGSLNVGENGNTTISNTKLGYLKDVTSNIQTQITAAMTSSQWTIKSETVYTPPPSSLNVQTVEQPWNFAVSTNSAQKNTKNYYVTPNLKCSIRVYTSPSATGSADTYIRIYRVSSSNVETQIASDDDGGDGQNADLTFEGNANQKYKIAFGCYISRTGPTTLHIAPSATATTVQYLSYNGSVSIGDGTGSGTIRAGTFNATSDLRLKENIHDLSNSLEKICAIRGVEYNWKADETKKLHSGVIAQEVQESIPEAVNTDNEEQYSVNYNAIIGHLIEAVKTLKQEVDDLKGQLKK